MIWAFTAVILLAGTGDLMAIALGKRSWRYVMKAGTMFLIIALAATGLPEAGLYGYLVLAGLLFSVAGDIFLVLPSDRFLPGLISFFVAHLCYIAAFASPRAPTWPDGVAALVLVGIGVFFFARIRPGVARQGGKAMLGPVALYLTVISLMLLRAVVAREPLLLMGAGLFYLSDSILAWDRFVRPVTRADLAIMTTYFSAQYLIALSVVQWAM